jgi:hypothetical protein
MKRKELIDRMLEHPDNASYTAHYVMEDILSSVDEEYDITTPTHPWVMLMSAGSAYHTATTQTHQQLLGQIHPSLASTRDELLGHLSDKDIHIHALPARGLLSVIVNMDSFMSRIQQDEDQSRQVVLPKDTQLQIGNHYYKIDETYTVRVIEGHHPVVYAGHTDTVVPSTLHEDVLNASTLVFTVQVSQASIQVGTYDVTSLGLKERMVYEDQFYQIKAYHRQEQGWVPLRCVFHPRVFDHYEAVMGVRVLGNEVELYIPPIYLDRGLISPHIKVVIYSTQGKIHEPEYRTTSPDRIHIEQLYDAEDIPSTSDHLVRIDHLFNPLRILTNGRAGMSDAQIHDLVVHKGSSIDDLPITLSQFNTYATDRGFHTIVQSDDLTGRQWLLTSTPTDTYAGMPVMGYIPVETTLEALKEINGTYSDDTQVVIPPECYLIRDEDGAYRYQDRSYSHSLKLINPASVMNKLNNEEIYYTPFHTVLQEIEGVVHSTYYDYRHPKILAQTIHRVSQEVVSIPVLIGATVRYEERGIRVQVRITPSKDDPVAVEDLIADMMLTDVDGATYYIRPDAKELVEGVYQIDYLLKMSYLRKGDDVAIEEVLSSGSTGVHRAYLGLQTDLIIVIGTLDANAPYQPTRIDELLYRADEQQPGRGMVAYRLHTQLGEALPYLWQESVLLDPQVRYETYAEDIPLRHTITTIQISRQNPSPFQIDDECNVVFNDPVREGDIVKDKEGNIVYAHRKGDIVFDPVSNQPRVLSIQKRALRLQRWVVHAMADMIVPPDDHVYDEALLKITTNASLVAKDIQARVIGNTDLYYHPSDTVGTGMTADIQGLSATIPKQISMQVVLYVDKGYDLSLEAKEVDRKRVIEIISSMLSTGHFTTYDAALAITKGLTGAIKSVDIKGLPDGSSVLTLKDPKREAMILKKRLVSGHSGYHIDEDIHITYGLI